VEFTAHNIRLDDGTCTKPDVWYTMEEYPWFISAQKILELTFPGDKRQLRIADLGCLEGGYTVEFARMGFQSVGLEVRDSNIAACRYVKSKTYLHNLEFVQDDAWNIAKYGSFDAVFCCGLFYHIGRPRQFLDVLSSVTKRLMILQTHFAEEQHRASVFPKRLRRILSRVVPTQETGTTTRKLSRLTKNEGLPGRWYTEFRTAKSFRHCGNNRWASWDNRRSFWIQREYLLQSIRDVGFDIVLEQFDSLGPDIAHALTRGYYKVQDRGAFIGIRSHEAAERDNAEDPPLPA
jgi:2-polyprenyl-3-methyl-5-hydroxy-6-metoxy-1,4-benzoquinol methylase